MGGPGASENVTASASDAGRATTEISPASAQTESVGMKREKNGECSSAGGDESVDERIQRSKLHWSTLAASGCSEELAQRRPPRNWRRVLLCCSCNDEQDLAAASNVQEFKALQGDHASGGFFQTFYGLDADLNDNGELVMGKKFAEGGQAELYEAHVKWWYPADNEEDLRDGREYVLKVFKKGTFLKQLKSQLPQGLLKFHNEKKMEFLNSPTYKPIPRFFSRVYSGTLLKDGRFAFLLEKEDLDLRNLIERNMKLRTSEDLGPFSKEDVEFMMYRIALGVDWLHSNDIVHRDLKASNVLVKKYKTGYPKWKFFVADYECSIGVTGTGFFRAPEILQACKDGNVNQKSEVFSKAADVYGYGMICYEILTGKLPFEDHHSNDYNVVLSGKCPELPNYVEKWIYKLLGRCWQYDPKARPTIEEILDILIVHFVEARRYQEALKTDYGEDYRSRHHVKTSNS